MVRSKGRGKTEKIDMAKIHKEATDRYQRRVNVRKVKVKLRRLGYSHHCVVCGKELPPGRKTFCSDGCSYKYYHGMVWIGVKNDYLKQHPQCERCGAPAVEVHHIVPICEGGDIFDTDNLMALCHECHMYFHSHEYKILKENYTLDMFEEV